MQVQVQSGTILLKLGRVFTVRDAERMAEMLKSFGPFSELVVDFTSTHEFHDAAFPALYGAMQRLTGVRVTLRGMTEHQSRLLRYLDLPVAELHAPA